MNQLNKTVKTLFILVICFICIVPHDQALASPQDSFSQQIEAWNEKRALASEYLFKAEKEFKEGDVLSGRAMQMKASEYGIEATNSLIEAMKTNNSLDGMENLETGLKKWTELGNMC